MYRRLRLLLARLWTRIGWAPPSVFPNRRVYFEISHPSLGDGYFVREVYNALGEIAEEYQYRRRAQNPFRHGNCLERKTGTYIASNGVILRWSASRVTD